MQLLILIFISILPGIAPLAQSSKPQPAATFAESAGPPDANPQYFPTGVFAANPDLSDFCARWYSKHLRAMGAESLLSASTDKQTRAYRFLWLRTFHHPIASLLRIRPDGSGQLDSVKLTGAGGYEPGGILTTQSVEISKEQVDKFEALISAADFWASPTPDLNTSGKDGALWILEGVKEQKYHVVDRWTPKDGAYREACLYLLGLSKIEVNKKEIY
jgi:hypothetical protein